MSLIEVFVRNPVKVAVGVLLVALFGIIALMRMPMQLTPEVQIPTITVETNWPGASPQEVEQEIVIEQEEQLTSVEGITKLSSAEHGFARHDHDGVRRRHRHGGGAAQGEQPAAAGARVSGRRRRAGDQHVGFVEPVHRLVHLQPEVRHAGRDRRVRREASGARRRAGQRARNAHNAGVRVLRLRELAAKTSGGQGAAAAGRISTSPRCGASPRTRSKPASSACPAFRNRPTFGGLEDELQVVVDPEKLAARRLTLTDVRNVLRSQNEDTSAGDFWEGKRRWVVRAMGQFRSPEQVENQLLAIRDGAPVFVRDVAEVRLGYKKPDGFVRRFGESSIAVNATRETDANVLDVMAGLQADHARAEPRGAPSARPAAHAGLRRNRVHLFGHRPGEGQHLRRRRADDGRADAVPAPGSANAAGDSLDHDHGRDGVVVFALVFRDFRGADRWCPASGLPAVRWSSGS